MTRELPYLNISAQSGLTVLYHYSVEHFEPFHSVCVYAHVSELQMSICFIV